MKLNEYKNLKRPASKYRNVKTNGYDSKKEAARADALKIMQRFGYISNLREQVGFELIPAQWTATKPKKCLERACKYYADFVYTRNGETIVEDAKGKKTTEYRIKRKLMLYKYGIQILET